MKRVGLVSAAVALSLGVLGMFAPNASALGNTCTWTGTGGDGKFSTATNWTGCAGGVPSDLDSLAFDTTPLTSADVNINNDLPGLQVDGISLTGTGSRSFVVTGNEIILAGNLTSNASGNLFLLLNNTLAADISMVYTGAGGGHIGLARKDFGQTTYATGVTNLNGHNLTIDGDSSYVYLNTLSGTGNLRAINNASIYFKYGTFSSWSGSIVVDSGSYLFLYPGQIAPTVPVTITSGASAVLCSFNGADFGNTLNVGGTGLSGGAIITSPGIACAGAGGWAPGFSQMASVNLTGSVTLTADTTVLGQGELKISGALSGNYTIAMAPSEDGNINITSSNNTSGAQGGVQESTGVTTTFSGDKPTEFVSLGTKDTGILAGTYAAGSVNGLLKGNGVFINSLNILVSGHVAPGNSPGCITSDTLYLSGTYDFELGGTDACTGYDQLKVLNAAATGAAVTLDNTSSVLTASRYNGYTPKQGDVFVIIDQAGTAAVSGTFKDLPEGATFSQNGITFKISYVGGTGNDVTLTVMNQPTAPDTGVMILKSNPIAIVAGAIVAAIALIGMAKLSKQRR